MNAEKYEGREPQKTRKRPPRQKRNPIETAINSWYEKREIGLKSQHALIDLIAQAPKRWTAYGPLVLLPAGSFTSAAWRDVLDVTANPCIRGPIDEENGKPGEDAENPRDAPLLWKMILDEISASPRARLTHLAINEGIPLRSRASSGGTAGEGENILRSPSGLRTLYGDFGPSASSSSSPTSALRQNVLRPEDVAEGDFSRAFWVSTKQNGITQTWAPRWTMFSRGNVKEKARLLDFHDCGDLTASALPQEAGDLSHRRIPAARRRGHLAVDLYAGIGYFAFCYAALGFRVLCWELNAWSVEGLRRGAAANGWSVRVIRPPSERRGETEGEDGVLREVLAGDEMIVVFLEDNARAAGRVRRLDRLTRERETQRTGEGEDSDGMNAGLRMSDVMHVNCGLLPTSRGSWATALDIASEARQAWIHVHENIGVSDIEAKKEEIREWFAERAGSLERDGEDGVQTDVCAEHVELVKTFAPGVWHCVFDLYVRRFPDTKGNIT